MRMMLCALFLGLVGICFGDESVPPERTAFSEKLSLLDEPIHEFEDNYEFELRKLEGKAKEAGQLELLLRTRKEIEEFRDQREEVEGEYKELLKLRLLFEAHLKKLEEKRTSERRKLTQTYLGVLAAKKGEHTRRDEIEAALVLKKEEEWARELLQKEAGPQAELVEKAEEEVPPLGDAPLLEGYSKSLEHFTKLPWKSVLPDKHTSFWGHANGSGTRISWETAKVNKVPKGDQVTFVWIGSLGKLAGSWDLSFNGQLLVQLSGPVLKTTVWKGKESTLRFDVMRVDKEDGGPDGTHGVFYLTVSSEAVVEGQVQTILVTERQDDANADGFFMVTCLDSVIAWLADLPPE